MMCDELSTDRINIPSLQKGLQLIENFGVASTERLVIPKVFPLRNGIKSSSDSWPSFDDLVNKFEKKISRGNNLRMVNVAHNHSLGDLCIEINRANDDESALAVSVPNLGEGIQL